MRPERGEIINFGLTYAIELVSKLTERLDKPRRFARGFSKDYASISSIEL